MAKYFCPDCKKITFSLRYMTKSVWYTVGLQWCKNCNTPKPTKNCFEGLDELQRNPSDFKVEKKYPSISYFKPAVRDLYTVGFNPLRCVVCQEQRKLEGKMTCGDKDCEQRFFEQCIKPKITEEQILHSRIEKINQERFL